METGRHWRFGFLIGLAMTTAGVGCMLGQEEEEVGDDDSEINEGSDVSQVLKSTLILDEGCTAVKVGPYHLLTTARCVADKPAFKAGKTIRFKVASGATQTPPNLTALATEDAGDAGDGGARKVNKSTNDATIDKLEINPSWTSKCAGQNANKCPLGSVAASEAKDIAVILLDADLDSVPTLKVDLDEVGQNEPLLAVGSGCTKIDDNRPSTVKTVKTLAVPSSSVNHKGSVFLEAKEKVGGLNSAYVITPGSDWKTQDGPSLCLSDLGAPLFRANAAVVVGVTSSFTTFETGKLAAVTIEHTKVDTDSKVGTWLKGLKVETTHSCGESGCASRGKFDGGIPGEKGATTNGAGGTTTPEDAGKDADAPADPDKDGTSKLPDDVPVGASGPTNLGDEPEDPPKEPNDGTGIDAGKKAKKKKAEGCTTAAPGAASRPHKGGSPFPGLAVVMGIGISIASLRRRRSAS